MPNSVVAAAASQPLQPSRAHARRLCSSQPVVVIDPGPALPDHVEAILDAMAEEESTHILITHTHKDHSPAAGEAGLC